MASVFLKTCLCMAVGLSATVTNVRQSTSALETLKVTQVVCDIVLLTTGTGEECLRNVLQVITESSGFVAVCCCSASTDIRAN